MRLLLLFGGGGLMLAALFLWFKPEPSAMPEATVGAAAPTSIVPDIVVEHAPPDEKPQALVLTLSLQQGVPEGGVPVESLVQGRRVVIRVTGDARDELHLHGYDLSAELHPGQVAEIAFDATVAGRFELESHHAHQVIAVLEVTPR